MQAAICSTCKLAVENRLPLPTDSRGLRSKNVFVTSGFSNWGKALNIKNHEKSAFHREAANGLTNMRKKSLYIHYRMQKQNK